MTSNRARKTDATEELRLIRQIEMWSIKNGIKLEDLYNLDDLATVFVPEMRKLELRSIASERKLQSIVDLERRWFDISREISDIQRISDMPKSWNKFEGYRIYFDDIHPMHYLEAQRRSNFKRRAWELRVFIKKCYNFHHELLINRLMEVEMKLKRLSTPGISSGQAYTPEACKVDPMPSNSEALETIYDVSSKKTC